MQQNIVNVTLKREEALILFEFLSRYSDDDVLSIQDDSEREVLWRLCTYLEKVLAEPLSEDWQTLLQKARDALNTK